MSKRILPSPTPPRYFIFGSLSPFSARAKHQKSLSLLPYPKETLATHVKVSRDMRYARRANGERRFNVEEFLPAQQIESYFSRTAAKLKHAVTAQSGHDSIDDNDRQAAQEQSFTSASCCIPLSTIR